MSNNFYGTKLPPAESLNEIAVKVLKGELKEAKVLIDNLELEIHIGKSFTNSKFLFNTNNKNFKTIEEFKKYWSGFSIKNEYGIEYTIEEFWAVVEDAQTNGVAPNDYQSYRQIDGYEFSKSTDFF